MHGTYGDVITVIKTITKEGSVTHFPVKSKDMALDSTTSLRRLKSHFGYQFENPMTVVTDDSLTCLKTPGAVYNALFGGTIRRSFRTFTRRS